MKFLKILLIFKFFIIPAFSFSIQPIELTPFGIPIIDVTLFDVTGESHKARFILDTATNISVIDVKLVGKYTTGKRITKDVITATNNKMDVEEVNIIQLQFGENIYKQIPMISLNFDDTFNMSDDHPIEGVIGMDLLNKLNFEIDFSNRLIDWRPQKSNSYSVIPIRIDDDGIPFVLANVCGYSIPCVCDTGSNEFISLPEKILAKIRYHNEALRRGSGIDSAGEHEAIYGFRLDGHFSIGEWSWENPKFTQSKDTQSGRLGCESFWPKVRFDFMSKNIEIYISNSNQKILCPPSEKPYQIIPLWKKVDGERKLVIAAVKPGSAMEKAGIHVGDVIIRFNNLENESLNIKSVLGDFSNRSSASITIERGHERKDFQIPSALP